jgi:hypothetical protein
MLWFAIMAGLRSRRAARVMWKSETLRIIVEDDMIAIFAV